MPIQQVRTNKSKTEVFGDIFSNVLRGTLQGKQLKRNQKMEDRDRAMREAMQVWQMAQKDYLNQPPMTEEQAREKAGSGKKVTTRYDAYGRPSHTLTDKSFLEQIIEAKMMLGESASIEDAAAFVKKMNEAGGVPEPLPDNGGLPAAGGSNDLLGGLNRGPNNVPPAPPPTPPTVPDQGILPTLEDQLGRSRPSQPSGSFTGPPTPPGFINPNWFGPAGGGMGSLSPSPFAPPQPVANRYAAGGMGGFDPGIRRSPSFKTPRTPAATAKPTRQYIKIAINPKTGQRIGWDGKQWVPIQ